MRENAGKAQGKLPVGGELRGIELREDHNAANTQT
ncbi:hypothetical protein Ga0451573_003631 [Peptococcaceae bacterium DYL19]|nr:hypothetical protein [Phosphitispora fastidiosa]